MNFRYLAPLAAVLLTQSVALAASDADEQDRVDQQNEIDEVVVTGIRQRLYETGSLMDVIARTEVVDEHIIDSRQAVNLSEALAATPGVRVSNECAMCNVKRVMLNGMRGEHTTILTDGLPLHTMMAGYYAVDAIATTGVRQIEVARGAGASLIAPEAIGGTINVVSREPDHTGIEIDAAIQEDDGYLASVFASLVSDDGRHRLSFVTQLDSYDKVDSDNNGVTEAPLLDNQNFVLRASTDFTDSDNLTLRVAFIDSEIFGGPADVDDIDTLLAGFDGIESAQLFENDDVRQQYVGKPWETAEWIDTERVEVSSAWLHEFNDRFNTTLSGAYSEHDQDSFYEGFDYAAVDELTYLDIRNNFVLSDNHVLTFGADRRDEQMRSQSVAGEASDNYIEDSFDYVVNGLYLQDTWTTTDQLDIALAIRFDSVEADFVAPEKPGIEIDESVVAPRLDARYRHTDSWASRFSAGRGYRAPLSFFETDHGILDAGDGFAIDIDRLEESVSLSYALSYEGERLTSTFSIATIEVENLAAMDETATGVPLLTQLDEKASVNSVDIAVSYRVLDGLTVSGTAETFDYDDAFASSYAIAPVEERITGAVDYAAGQWSFFGSVQWIGERDLADYGYEGFNVFDTQPKSTMAPDYWTIDFKLSREIGEGLSFYVGATNLLDETQAGDMDTPLFFDADGGYDVGYIYGPLRGREVYAGFTMEL